MYIPSQSREAQGPSCSSYSRVRKLRQMPNFQCLKINDDLLLRIQKPQSLELGKQCGGEGGCVSSSSWRWHMDTALPLQDYLLLYPMTKCQFLPHFASLLEKNWLPFSPDDQNCSRNVLIKLGNFLQNLPHWHEKNLKFMQQLFIPIYYSCFLLYTPTLCINYSGLFKLIFLIQFN